MPPKKPKDKNKAGRKGKNKGSSRKKQTIPAAEPLSLLPILNLAAPNTPLRAYRVKWDWEVKQFGGTVREVAPAPCVFRCGELENNLNGHYTPLNKAWQFFWFDLCCLIVFDCYHKGLKKKDYDWLTGIWTGVGGNKIAFMNLKGLDKFRNHVGGVRLDKEDAAIYTLVCGGATLTGTPITNSKGKLMLKVDHFDGTKPPPAVETIDPYTDPRVFFANIIGVKKIGNGFKVFPFPQLEGRDVPVPLIAKTDIYYPMEDLEEITFPFKPSPYFL